VLTLPAKVKIHLFYFSKKSTNLLETLKLLLNYNLCRFSESIFRFVFWRNLWRCENGDEFGNPSILKNVFFFLKLELDVKQKLRNWLPPIRRKSLEVDQILRYKKNGEKSINNTRFICRKITINLSSYFEVILIL
jgi:hypothetical protein